MASAITPCQIMATTSKPRCPILAESFKVSRIEVVIGCRIVAIVAVATFASV